MELCAMQHSGEMELCAMPHSTEFHLPTIFLGIMRSQNINSSAFLEVVKVTKKQPWQKNKILSWIWSNKKQSTLCYAA
jgi:hypothetical protein